MGPNVAGSRASKYPSQSRRLLTLTLTPRRQSRAFAEGKRKVVQAYSVFSSAHFQSRRRAGHDFLAEKKNWRGLIKGTAARTALGECLAREVLD